MRIGLIHFTQETNDFNPALTDLAAFRSFGVIEGQEIIDQLTGIGQIGGCLEVAKAHGAEVVPIYRGFSLAGGRISREAFDDACERMAKGLKAAGRLDGLALQLHGACAAEGVDDVEGEQAALCRSILGPDVPIALGLDHHANLTRKMVESVDAICAHRTQPHDTYDTGKVGAELLFDILEHGKKPVMAWRKIPLISHQEQFLTRQAPMKIWFDRARAMEASPVVMQVAPIPMQPWLDVSEGGWSVVVVTDGDADLAEKLADEMADLAWSLRDDFQVSESIPVDEAVRQADAAESGIVVLSDTGDTVFGGSSGDSNILLEAMLRLNIANRALVPTIAPKAIDRIWGCKVGDVLTLPVGGETATQFFTPLEVTGTVKFVGDDLVELAGYTHQRYINMGRRLVLEIGPVTLLMTELRGVAGNMPGVYSASGVDVSAHKMAVMKTASNFQYFDEVSSGVIRVASPGPGQSDLASLPWKNLPRPIYPFEELADWRDGPVTTWRS